MAVNIPHVSAGDLITATYVNAIADGINDLQAQLDALGTGPPASGNGVAPVITSVDLDASGSVQAGTTMTIHGLNFAVPAVLNSVSLNGAPLSDFTAGSTDTTLKVNVPGDLQGLPATMTLEVSTSGGSDQTSVHVVAAVMEIGGEIAITNATGDVGTITPGATALFQFQLDASALDVAEQFTVEAIYTAAVGASISQWNAGTTYVGTTGSNHQVTVDPRVPVVVGVDVVVPDSATSVNLTLAATSVHNDPGSSGEAASIPITVGEALPPTDPSMHIELGTNNRSNLKTQTFTGDVSGDGLVIKYGGNPVVTISAEMDHAGDYQFTAVVENADATLWVIGSDLPETLTFADGQSQDLQFNLKLVPTSAPASSVTRYFTLTATRQQDDAVGQISSYLRFPIGGF